MIKFTTDRKTGTADPVRHNVPNYTLQMATVPSSVRVTTASDSTAVSRYTSGDVASLSTACRTTNSTATTVATWKLPTVRVVRFVSTRVEDVKSAWDMVFGVPFVSEAVDDLMNSMAVTAAGEWFWLPGAAATPSLYAAWYTAGRSRRKEWRVAAASATEQMHLTQFAAPTNYDAHRRYPLVLNTHTVKSYVQPHTGSPHWSTGAVSNAYAEGPAWVISRRYEICTNMSRYVRYGMHEVNEVFGRVIKLIRNRSNTLPYDDVEWIYGASTVPEVLDRLDFLIRSHVYATDADRADVEEVRTGCAEWIQKEVLSKIPVLPGIPDGM